MHCLLADRGHRATVVFAGDRDWGRDQLNKYRCRCPSDTLLWISDRPPVGVDALSAKKARKLLGRETDMIVFDGFSGVDVDAIGAVGGTIRAGGLFVLLMPDMQDWRRFDDPERTRMTVYGYTAAEVGSSWFEHLQRCLLTSAGILVVTQRGTVHGGQVAEADPPARLLPRDRDCATIDQAEAVAVVIRSARGHRHRPVVLISDRGRGKSAALGIAAARMLREPGRQLLLTAANRASVESVFSHASRLLPESVLQGGRLSAGSSALEFIAPKDLCEGKRSAAMVLVDEAAALSLPQLHDILTQYPRIAFATTVHGYEGSGRSFEVRFTEILDAHNPGWRQVQLQIPIRWAPGDPLEQWLFRALLLDASVAEKSAISSIAPAHLESRCLSKKELVQQPGLLEQIFALLVQAHYRTRPYDLRYLLDAPNVNVVVVLAEGSVVATALVAREGGFDPATARAITDGLRRPRGHLLPESLGVHLGLCEGPLLRHDRIVRIAVHPALRRRGLGSALISFITQRSLDAGVDGIGTSFGATPELISFWYKSGLYPMRFGVRRGTASGINTLLLMKGLSADGIRLMRQASDQFIDTLRHQLTDTLTSVPASTVVAVLNRLKRTPVMCDGNQLNDAAAFAFGGRSYEDVVAALEALVWSTLTNPGRCAQLRSDQTQLLVARLLQKRAWKDCAELCRTRGRAGVLVQLRKAIASILEVSRNPAVRKEIIRLRDGRSGSSVKSV